MNERMNEKFIHAFISKKLPQSAETEQNDKIKNTQNKKVVIGDNPVQICTDVAVTTDDRL